MLGSIPRTCFYIPNHVGFAMDTCRPLGRLRSSIANIRLVYYHIPMSTPSCRELIVHNNSKELIMDEYEYELLNMSLEEMDKIANGKGDDESKNTNL